MECVEMALKSSFRPEVFVKAAAAAHSQAVLLDDFWGVSGQTAVAGGGGSGDDFFVDDLLDFSKDDGFVEDVDVETAGENNSRVAKVTEEEKSVISTVAAVNSSVNDGSVSVPQSELCVPADDLEDLEWVSHFVDDSFPGYSLTYPAGKLPETPLDKKPVKPEVSVPVNNPSYTTPVHTKARSKRARTGGRVWSLGSLSLTESSTSSSSSSSCTSIPWLIYGDITQTAESLLGKPPVIKKPKKKKPAAETGGGAGGQQGRRCSHCGVQKTPQWRTGPMGAKTLCNACGVRFKSGRLLPEYRPACSPTFSSEVHSNNHRKVLEMRRKKEVETGSGLPVQNF